MVSMSPRKAAPKHITLPPRIMSLSARRLHPRSRGGSADSGTDSNPCTPSPRTPLPYSCEYISGALRLDSPLLTPSIQNEPDMLNLSATSSTKSNKRAREDEQDENVRSSPHAEWTAEDLEIVRATVLHPYRPLSSAYPPGELAPPHILDEITTQICNHSNDLRLVSAKSRRAERRAALAAAHVSSESSSSDSTPNAEEENTRAKLAGWNHSWESTRKRVYLASVDVSRAAHGLNAEKVPLEERIHRPGLRRMDSMDFLDQEEDNSGPSSQVGRALRLSTTLQNTTKNVPTPMLTRSASLGGSLSNMASTPPAARPQRPTRAATSNTPIIPPSLTLTPASPQKASSSSTSPSSAAPSVRRGRKVSSARPSLLQRGRSFTASDLGSVNGEDSDEEMAARATGEKKGHGRKQSISNPSSPRVPFMSALSSGRAAGLEGKDGPTFILGGELQRTSPPPAMTMVAAYDTSPTSLTVPSLETPLPIPETIGLGHPSSSPSPPKKQQLAASPRLLRAPQSPSTKRQSGAETKNDKGGWSDSDDDFLSVKPVAKKLRPRLSRSETTTAAIRTTVSKGAGIGRSGSMMFGNPLLGAHLGSEGGLASPFEEKTGLL